MLQRKEYIITVNNMTKSFGEIKVLSGINLAIQKGEIFCLLGSNGAGKTTLVKILSTLLMPDYGTAYINGYELRKNTRQVRQAISLTGQYAALDSFLTGRENLELIANLRHVKDPKVLAAKMLRQFGLTDASDRQTTTYSGGMRRRLDIAMSLVGEPSILFLDEPTTGLDPQSRISMWKLIRSLAERGVTVFLTTQYIEEAEQLADNIAVLDEGVITARGSLGELLGLYPGAETLEQVFLSIVENKEVH